MEPYFNVSTGAAFGVALVLLFGVAPGTALIAAVVLAVLLFVVDLFGVSG